MCLYSYNKERKKTKEERKKDKRREKKRQKKREKEEKKNELIFPAFRFALIKSKQLKTKQPCQDTNCQQR